MTLNLLQDGSCSIRNECRRDAAAVAERCPQLDKCGSCVMWSARGESRSFRNEGICLLEPDARRLLDCGSAACPYYRPRRESPAYVHWRTPARRPAAARPRVLGREAPAPTAAALAIAALQGTAASGTLAELALEVTANPARPLPPLLERFRGGTAVLGVAGGAKAVMPIERVFLWICSVKRSLESLEAALNGSGLGSDDKDKIGKDIKAMRGSMTTFNVLFRDKEDHFVGQKSG